MARTVMGDVLYTMDITDGLLLCLSAEPQPAADVMDEWVTRTGRNSTAMTAMSTAHRLGRLVRRGLVTSERDHTLKRTVYAITRAGEDRADQLYNEYL